MGIGPADDQRKRISSRSKIRSDAQWDGARNFNGEQTLVVEGEGELVIQGDKVAGS